MAPRSTRPLGRTLRLAIATTILASAGLLAPGPARADETVETIVLVRHGEKPEAGLGQLNCRGLSRALALPDVIARELGRPDTVFAPDPSIRKEDGGTAYDYVRPLATIEPTAIRYGLPVDTRFGWNDVDGLAAALTAPALARSRVLVAWEHKEIVEISKKLIAANGGDPAVVPKWRGDDFESIHVLTLSRDAAGTPRVRFDLRRQGLGDLGDTCPGARRP
ncbi:hypothetical protein [Pinisolibacter aquiterrae]|uniref:hypothetical protein n=1 Tax=Pinisolibacter aquiterrae TaxID=2815579 RepID=UPI001C3DEA30|nr:hypothetical protein [Pinisolibacter aquiterrae]MBV5265267.1 hypothetical protein [Pinisolibacter aquiterrae]MCC8235404.1 hypothetical protein [Pinisolibacter aquiterrae]